MRDCLCIVVLQQTQQSPEMGLIIQQEACYAAIGKVFTQSNSYNERFEDWYARELRYLLRPPQDSGPAALGNRILTARATILVGSCFSALTLENWREAFTQLVKNLHYQDVVIKLTSVVALSMLLYEVLQEVEVHLLIPKNTHAISADLSSCNESYSAMLALQ